MFRASGNQALWTVRELSRRAASQRLLRLKRTLVLISALGLAACEPSPSPRVIDGSDAAETTTKWSSGPIDGFHIVDCQFPGRMLRLPGGTPVPIPGRIARTTAEDCTDNLGRYIVYEPSNFAGLLDIWLPKAEGGDAEAQMYVADIYVQGLDGLPDYSEAARWYDRAAEQDYEPAKVRLSNLVEKGLGVPRNRERAVALVEEATGLEVVEAMASKESGEKTAARNEEVAFSATDPAESDRIERELEERVAEISTKQQELARREAELEEAREQLTRQQGETETVQNDAAADRAEIEDLRSVVARLESTLRDVKKDLAESRDQLMRDGRMLSEVETVHVDDAMIDRLRDFDFGDNHALVVGNSTYPNLSGGQLESAVNDAEAVTELLEERYGYNVISLYNATRGDILNALRILKEELDPSHNLLVYYAGHGEFQNDQGYWLANDFGDDPNAAIPTSEITGILRSIDAKHVMVISDSCYARALIEDNVQPPYGVVGPAKEAWIRVTANRPVRMAFTSGGLKPVLDNGGGRHSIFAAALLKELGTNHDVMEGARLFWSVAAHVQQAAKELRLEQSPTYSSIEGGDDIGGDYFFVPVGG